MHKLRRLVIGTCALAVLLSALTQSGSRARAAPISTSVSTAGLSVDSCSYKWTLWGKAKLAGKLWGQYYQAMKGFGTNPQNEATPPQWVAAKLHNISRRAKQGEKSVGKYLGLMITHHYLSPQSDPADSIVWDLLWAVDGIADSNSIGYQSDQSYYTLDVARNMKELWPTLKAIPCRPRNRVLTYATVSPASMVYGTYPTLSARTSPGAICKAAVVYSTGHTPVSFHGISQQAGSSDLVSWHWHEETIGDKGIAEVLCQRGNQVGDSTASFTVG